jgi:hypothetical protein
VDPSKENFMNMMISLALVILGAVLLTMGVAASNSIASDFSRFFTGEPTNRTTWLLLGGLVALLAGAGTWMGSRMRSDRR